ncbi:MAG: nitroreductase family protein [Deltaproteobacteria bacterium]|nr:nitroreductase family protein [Deltaproteobacteria bacterium]
MDKPAPSDQPIHPLLAGRWSGRSFDASRDVDLRTLHGLLEAARWAPSCSNEQPWRFVLGARGVDDAHQGRWQAIFDGLAGGNKPWCKDASAFVVTLATRTFAASGKQNAWAWHDVGAAGLAIALQGHARGVVAHPMAGYEEADLRRSLDLPEDLDVVAVWALGFPGPADALEEPFRSRELAPRVRKPLSDLLL